MSFENPITRVLMVLEVLDRDAKTVLDVFARLVKIVLDVFDKYA